jgi:hypothetical protein
MSKLAPLVKCTNFFVSCHDFKERVTEMEIFRFGVGKKTYWLQLV